MPVWSETNQLGMRNGYEGQLASLSLLNQKQELWRHSKCARSTQTARTAAPGPLMTAILYK